MVFYNYISIIFMEKRGVYIMEITSKTESVVVKYEGHVATVMVNRPEVLNALDEPTLKELLQKLKEVAESSAHIVVLCGNGTVVFLRVGILNRCFQVMMKVSLMAL